MTIHEPIGWQDQPSVKQRRWALQEVRAQVAAIVTGETGHLVTVDELGINLRGDITGGCEDIPDAIMWECEDTFNVVIDPEVTTKITTASDLALAVHDDLRRQSRAE